MPLVCWLAFCRSGASCRHGGHHEPQTLITTTLSAKSAVEMVSLLPSFVPETVAAGLRWAGGTTVTRLAAAPT